MGCRHGLDSEIWSAEGYRVLGIDFSQEMLTIACQRPTKATFKLLDIYDIDTLKEKFDLVQLFEKYFLIGLITIRVNKV